MATKIWYEVRVTCPWKSGMSAEMKDEVVAKVKSEGLAQLVKQKIKEVYGENSIVRVC